MKVMIYPVFGTSDRHIRKARFSMFCFLSTARKIIFKYKSVQLKSCGLKK